MPARFSPRPPWILLAGLLALGFLSSAQAAISAFSIPLATHGDAIEGSAGTALPLTPTSFLMATRGPDNVRQSPDDRMLLVTDLDTTPVITPLTIPFMSDYSGRITRFSATRAAVISAGPDDNWGNADDQVVLLDQLGSGNVITHLTVGGLDDLDAATAIPLTENSAVVRTRGPDNTRGTADDTLALLTDLGNSNAITHVSAPFTLNFSHATPVVLSPTSALVCSAGPDGLRRTADDGVHVFTNLGTTNNRVTVPLPNICAGAGGRPTRLSATRALIVRAGPDAQDGTADDGITLLDGIGTTNTVTTLAIPSIQGFGAGRPAALTETLAVVATQGPDSARTTADDTLAILSGLGTTNTVTHLPLPGLHEDAGSAPQRLSPTSVVVSTGGPNFTLGNSDDEVVVVSNVGATNTITKIPLGGLDAGVSSQAVPLGISSLLVVNGGPNNAMNSGGDDQITLITGVPGAPLLDSAPVSTEADTFALACTPQLLGEGRAVSVGSGPDGTVGANADDLIRVLTSLPQPRGLEVRKVQLFKGSNPAASHTLRAGGKLQIDDPTLLSGVDLTISLGNAAQRLPAALIKTNSRGIVSYSDPRGARGFIRKVILNPVSRTFIIEGRGPNTGAQTTATSYVPVAVDAGELYLSDVVKGKAVKKGIRFP